MSIGGKVREKKESGILKTGLFAGNVLCINPSVQEYKEILGIELKEDSKATEYIGESKEGNTTLRINVWVQNIKGDFKQPITFFLENKQKENKTEEGDGKVKKFQYINNIGTCTWGTDRDTLPDWFTKRGDFRIAFVGEEELYGWVRTWLGKLDYKDPDTTVQLEWKQLMKGNLKTLKEQIGGDYCTPFVSMATIKTIEKEDGLKEYQGIWNKGFLPEYALKQFRIHNYDDDSVLDQIKKKESKDLKPFERFILNASGEYGIKDFYKFQDLKEYDPKENVVAQGETKEGHADDLPF